MVSGGVKDVLVRAWALVGLAVLGLAAALAVDYVASVSPAIPMSRLTADPCDARGRALLLRLEPARIDCRWHDDWQRLLPQPDSLADSEGLKATEEPGPVLHLEWSLTLPADDDLVYQVREGKALPDPAGFVRTFAEAGIPVPDLAWSAPTLTDAPSGGKTTITSTADLSPDPSSGPYPLLVPPGTVDVTTHSLEIVKVDGITETAQTPTHLSGIAHNLGQIGLQPVGKTDSGPDVSGAGTHLAQLRSAASPLGTAATTLLTGAVVWAALWLAGRWGFYGPLGQRAPWVRFLRLVGVVLAVHVVVTWQVASGSFDLVLLNQIGWLTGWLWSPGSWTSAGSPLISGSTLLLMAEAITLLPAALRRWRHAGHEVSAPSRPVRRSVLGWFAALSASAFSVALAATMTDAPRLSVPPLILLYGGLLLVLCLLTWLGQGLLRQLGDPAPWAAPSLGWLVAVTLLLLPVAQLDWRGGLLPLMTRWVTTLLPGTAAVLCLMLLLWSLAQLAWERPTVAGPLTRIGRGVLLPLAPVAVLASVPVHTGPFDVQNRWIDLFQSLDGLAALLLVAAAVPALRAVGWGPVRGRPELLGHRTAGIVLAAIAFSSGFSFYRSSSVWALLAAAAGAWLLFPREQVEHAARVLMQGGAQRRRRIGQVVEAGTARRQLPATRSKLREKTAADGVDWRRQLLTVRSLEKAAMGDQAGTPSGATDLRQYAFGSFASRRPWQRARLGAAAGAVAGLPWTALSLAGTASIDAAAPYPWADLPARLIPAVLHWTAYGFLFGYFFPLLRGRTGFAKGLALFAAGTAPTVLDAALRDNPAPLWTTTVVGLLQFFSFGLTLGLWADRITLRRYRYHWLRLADVHNLGAVAAWASSVFAATATGLAALLLVGVQPFITGLVQPPAPPPTPTPQSSQTAAP